MTKSNPYNDDEFWKSEPTVSEESKDSLETYLNNLSTTYAKVRSEDAFKPHLQYMIGAGSISFAVALIVGYYSIPDGQSFSMPFASNDQLSTFANKFEFAFILGTSAAAAAAIVFAALGGHAVQSQNDRLSALSDKMDHTRDRIASMELKEAIDKREKMRTSSSQITPDQFYGEIGRDILGEKLFTEEGNVKLDGIDALQVGVPTKVTFTSKVKGEDNKFPSGDNQGEGTMTLNADGTVDASYVGILMTDNGRFEWQSRGKLKVVDGGKLKGIEILIGFSQRIVMDTQMDLSPPRKFTNTAYEWKFFIPMQ